MNRIITHLGSEVSPGQVEFRQVSHSAVVQSLVTADRSVALRRQHLPPPPKRHVTLNSFYMQHEARAEEIQFSATYTPPHLKQFPKIRRFAKKTRKAF